MSLVSTNKPVRLYTVMLMVYTYTRTTRGAENDGVSTLPGSRPIMRTLLHESFFQNIAGFIGYITASMVAHPAHVKYRKL